ncbi:hypothetical protein K461DRAFT_170560 [Myriangium duriaei CBS 260.36]|uniref:Uncharacterized protein n=1 Tax=Myriangium duriaei CBS 260.36 TaxID=1168546 RepID=A0A9P4IYJ1_9PEZI|nr:hypothetical protein K461DRAFT_170560 [Myriangium duriaei CBS 260.36]
MRLCSLLAAHTYALNPSVSALSGPCCGFVQTHELIELGSELFYQGCSVYSLRLTSGVTISDHTHIPSEISLAESAAAFMLASDSWDDHTLQPLKVRTLCFFDFPAINHGLVDQSPHNSLESRSLRLVNSAAFP